jgi:hypothetical protein
MVDPQSPLLSFLGPLNAMHRGDSHFVTTTVTHTKASVSTSEKRCGRRRRRRRRWRELRPLQKVSARKAAVHSSVKNLDFDLDYLDYRRSILIVSCMVSYGSFYYTVLYYTVLYCTVYTE